MQYPLTIFEKYMFFDDTPEYPMDSFRQIRLSGSVNTEVFAESIKTVVAVNPLLRSIIKKTGSRKYVWQDVEQPVFVRVSDELVPERINIKNQPGFRSYIRKTADETSVLFQFHHSVSDGLGEMEFIGDVLTDYAQRVKGETPPPPQRDASLLPLRGKSGLTLKSYIKNYINTMYTTNQLLFGSPDPLKPLKETAPAPIREYFTFITSEMTPETTKTCFAEAKKCGVTINDYLLAALFSAMYRWREQFAASETSGTIPMNPLYRLAVPLSLRTPKHKNIPASNSVTMLFIDRRLRQCGDRQRLIKNVHREMVWAKRAEQKHYLLLSLRIRDFLPGGIPAILKSLNCRSTIVLSNLGRVFETLPLSRRADGKIIVGDAVLESVDAAPPIRRGTLISFSVLTYSGSLRFILRYDSQNMTKNEAETFLEYFVKELSVCM
ncbi:hypothetical protein FACS1894170_12400 [Planctomycetales bacterium]|nr:hypothetical protein FACS1894170_12400 [Planctomycetales bacterium]